MEKGKGIGTWSKTGNGRGQGAEAEPPDSLMCSLKFSLRVSYFNLKPFLIFFNWSTPAFIGIPKSLSPRQKCQESAFLFCYLLFSAEVPHSMEGSPRAADTSSMLSLFTHKMERASYPGHVSLYLSQRRPLYNRTCMTNHLPRATTGERQRKGCGSRKASL